MPGIGAERVLPCAAVLRNRKRFLSTPRHARQNERTKEACAGVQESSGDSDRPGSSQQPFSQPSCVRPPIPDERQPKHRTAKAKQMGDEAGRPADRDAWRGGRVPRLPTTPSRLNQTKGTGRTGHTARDKRARHRTMIG